MPTPRVVRFSADALRLFNDFEDYVRHQVDSLRARGLAGLWGKVEAQAMRLALIYACSENCHSNEITEKAATWAIELISILTNNMVLYADRHVSSNRFEAETKKILEQIRRAATTGISRTELVNRNRDLTPRQLDEIITTLNAGEMVAIPPSVTTKGRPRTMYFSTEVLKK